MAGNVKVKSLVPAHPDKKKLTQNVRLLQATGQDEHLQPNLLSIHTVFLCLGWFRTTIQFHKTMAESNDSLAPPPALSLDEVFCKKAPLTGERCKLRLSPLSKKACLVHGINPTVLLEREYGSFAQQGQDPEITTMKYEMYSRTREKLYETASNERGKLLVKAKKANDSFTSTNDSVSAYSKTSLATSIDRKEQEISTLIENEKRRLEKVAKRQQKEMLRMLEFEARQKEIMVSIKRGGV